MNSLDLALVHDIYSSVLTTQGLDGVLQQIANRHPDVIFTLQAQCTVRNRYFHLSAYNIDDSFFDDYGEVGHLNPFPKYMASAPVDRLYRSAETMRANEIEHTDFFDVVCRPRGQINRGTGIILHKQDTDVAFLAANLPKGYGADEEAELSRVLERTLAHSQSAFLLLLELKKRQSKSKAATFFLDRIPAAAFVVTADLKLKQLNGKAEALANQQSELRIEPGLYLRFRNTKSHDLVKTQVANVAKSGKPHIPEKLLGADRIAKLLFALPVSGVSGLPSILGPFLPNTSDVLLLIFDPSDVPPSSEVLLQMALGLTERESAVVQQLINGSGLREAADVLGITYNTARNHIAAVTDKIGANSQTAVVKMGAQILSRLPCKRLLDV